MKKVKEQLVGLTLMAVMAFAVYLFWNGFMRESFFSWTVSQDRYWNALVEMACAFIVYLCILTTDYSRKIYKGLLLSIVFLFFVYLHAYFYASLMGTIYFAMICLTGYVLCKWVCRKTVEKDIHLYVVAGIAGIILIISVASLFKVGTPEKLRIILPIIFLLELAICLKDIRICLGKIKEKGTGRSTGMPFVTAACIALIMTAVTINACRANLGTDYDSLWYGYRSELVLAPDTGIFDNPYLLSTVYTYSKGIEVLSLPFSGLSSLSYITAINIMFSVLTIHAVYRTVKAVSSERMAFIAAAFIAITPSIMNMAITAKSDSATFYLQALALCYGCKGIKEKNSSEFWKAYTALLLSYVFKPSSFIFSTTIVAVLVAIQFVYKVKLDRKEIGILAFGLIPVILLFLRTYLLTGVPIASLFAGIWSAIGLEVKAPYELGSSGVTSITSLLQWDFLCERATRLLAIFTAPKEEGLSHIQIAWWGPLATVAWLVSLSSVVFRLRKTWGRFKEDPVYAFHTGVFLLCSGLSIGTMLLLNRPDGNYYGLFCIVSYIQLFLEINSWEGGIKSIHKCGGILLAACNTMLLLAISWSWIVGLTPIDMNKKGYYDHEVHYVIPKLESKGLKGIYDKLNEESPRHVMDFMQDAETYFLFPVIGDAYYQQMTWAPNSLKDAASLLEYMNYAEVDGVIADRALLTSDSQALRNLLELANAGFLQMELQAGEYALLHVSLNEPVFDQSAVDYLVAFAQ